MEKAFASDEEWITFLFALYEQYTAPLTAEAERLAAGKKGKHRSQKKSTENYGNFVEVA